jgi:peptidoglycan/LPS O-acetylase OafA/YrhL
VSLNSFFVRSGFLITALLLREQAKYGKIGTLPFYRRRALRLLPALYVVVVANALFAWASHQWLHTEWPSIFSVLFYYSNYYSASAAGPLSPKLASGYQHLWSLSFEEQFYLIWPWLTIALLTIRMRLRTVVIILLSLITVIAVRRYVLYEDTHQWWSLFYRTDTRADSILWGALLAHIWVRGKEPKRGLTVAGWIAAAFLLACLPYATQEGPSTGEASWPSTWPVPCSSWHYSAASGAAVTSSNSSRLWLWAWSATPSTSGTSRCSSPYDSSILIGPTGYGWWWPWWSRSGSPSPRGSSSNGR